VLMLNESRLVGFVATKNPEAAREFYEQILGLALISDEPVALVFDANGTMLRVAKVQELSPAKYTVLGWEVADIRSEVKELRRRGVQFEHYDGLPQDESGIWTSPAGAQVAWFRDPDGNTLSLTQIG
jgi:catechol 2,3-dioxygenase-like lactoylglutathione lyase family enzyme